MPIDPDRFRLVLRHLAGGVALVTSRRPDGSPCGMTATSVCSVSLEPPLVLACLDTGTNTHRAIEGSGLYAINLLAREHEAVAVRFARDDPKKFRGLDFETAATGAPVLPWALGWCDCSILRSVTAGDHTIFIGRVEAARLRERTEPRPLVYYRGRYATLAPEAEAEAGAGIGPGPGSPPR